MHFSPPLSTWECCQNWETWGQLREPVLGQAAARRVRVAMWILLPPTRETISCLAQKYRGGQRGAAGKGTQLHLAQTEQKWVIGLFSMKENSFSCVAACLPAGFPSRWKTTLSVTIEAAVEVEEKQGWGCGQGVLAGQAVRTMVFGQGAQPSWHHPGAAGWRWHTSINGKRQTECGSRPAPGCSGAAFWHLYRSSSREIGRAGGTGTVWLYSLGRHLINKA